MTDEAEAFVNAFREGWRAPGGADGFFDGFLPHLDPEIRLIQPQMPTVVGLEAFRRDFAEPAFALMPDLRAEVGSWAASGNTVFIEFELVGTLGGRPIRFPAVDRIEIRNGRAVERRAYFDASALLGAVLTRPRAWPRFARLQLRQLRKGITDKRKGTR